MYLVDTNVVSELRRIKPHGAVVSWIESVNEADLFLSAVTLAEIQAGIEITREQDEARATELELWLNAVAESYNIIPMDARTFRLWAKLMHRKSDTLYEDAMIAATAKVHNFSVVTRNVSDFVGFDVPIVNPFDG
ncbi:MAG: VapC toxin family PIN domain ribonuclease [Proteobacteria bacterium]|nr:MAG: VapC toxin family PIN domain ribonuclease [Pseudomonadota bacterium]